MPNFTRKQWKEGERGCSSCEASHLVSDGKKCTGLGDHENTAGIICDLETAAFSGHDLGYGCRSMMIMVLVDSSGIDTCNSRT